MGIKDNKMELSKHLANAYPIKISALHSLHDEELFYSSLGRSIIELKNHLFDLESGDTELFEKFLINLENDDVLENVKENVLPLINEIEYIKNIVKAIVNEDCSCKFFSHFIENLSGYMGYVDNDFRDWKLVKKLKQQEHLLSTIYYKQELEHFANEKLIPLMKKN